MNKGIVITLPNYDYVTNYLSVFSGKILTEANNHNLKVKKLEADQAVREQFEKVMNKLDYQMIIFNGHGSETTITGHKGKVLVQNGINEKLLHERIVYARACNAGQVLGNECVKDSKSGCFIGYSLPFMFFIDQRWQLSPHKDNIAPLFLEPSNIVPISLIKGNSAKEAHENSKKQILKNINKILRKTNNEALAYAQVLWNNYTGQVLIGNANAQFT